MKTDTLNSNSKKSVDKKKNLKKLANGTRSEPGLFSLAIPGKLSELEGSILEALDRTAIVSVTDADGRIIYANERFLEISKYKKDELIGKNHRILKSGEHGKEFYSELWDTIASGKVWSGEVKNKAKDGSVFWLKTSIAPVIGSHGKPVYFIAIRVPITDIKEKEEGFKRSLKEKNLALEKLTLDMQRSLAEFECTFESMGECAIFSDSEGNLVRMNRAARIMLGFKPEDGIGRKVAKIVKFRNENNEIIAENERSLTLALKSRETVRATAQYKTKKNKNIWFSITAAPVILNGQLIGAIDIFHDMTLEKELDRIKTDFVSLASHQLRTPLTAIKLFTELLFNDGKLNEQQRLYLENIYNSTGHMVKLVNDLLHVAKIETNSFSLVREPVEVGEIIESAMEEIKTIVPNGHVNFLQKSQKTPPLITDPILMGQVIKNLISNALKYSLDKRCEITDDYQEEPGEYLVTVKDWGIGIPKKSQKKIFEKFYRADNAYLTSTDGVGIGLYSSKLIVELFGGKIWFESVEGKGTKFFVELPLNGRNESRLLF